MKLPLKLAKSQVNPLLALLLLGAFSIGCDRFIRISGHIRDSTGRPVGGAALKLYVTSANLTPHPDNPSENSRSHRSTSDDAGRFRISDTVAPIRLSFLLVVEKEGYRPLQKALSEPPAPKEDLVLEHLSPTGKESLIVGKDLGNGLTLFVPKTSAESMYFPKISEITKAGRLSDLRARPLPEDETEVRIWIGFGKAPLRGYVLRNGKSEFARLVQTGASNGQVTVSDLVPSDGDWFQAWLRLTKQGLLTLPDSSQLSDGVDLLRVKDGETIVFESSNDGVYRVYYYPAVGSQTWPEAKQAVQVIELLKTFYQPEGPK